MSRTNPTVPINVTARELRLISDLFGWNGAPGSLREKLTEAGKDMQAATRIKNREAKIARIAKRSPQECTQEDE